MRMIAFAVTYGLLLAPSIAAEVKDHAIGKVEFAISQRPLVANILGIAPGMSRKEALGRIAAGGYYAVSSFSSQLCYEQTCYKDATIEESFVAVGKGQTEDRITIDSTGVAGGNLVLSVGRKLLIVGSQDREFDVAAAEMKTRLNAKYGPSTSPRSNLLCWGFTRATIVADMVASNCDPVQGGATSTALPEILITAVIGRTTEIYIEDLAAIANYEKATTSTLQRMSGVLPEKVDPPNL